MTTAGGAQLPVQCHRILVRIADSASGYIRSAGYKNRANLQWLVEQGYVERGSLIGDGGRSRPVYTLTTKGRAQLLLLDTDS